MQEPLKYANDCNRLVGYLIDFYPWVLIEKNQMKLAYQVLNQYWKKEFPIDVYIDHLF
jgi:hypothetical protein